jgi:xanthine dehydrogenase YagS FAD-binding subunit
LAVNGVAPFPVRLEVVESFIKGKEPTDELGMAAGQLALSTTNAQPLRHNAFKLPLMRNLVRRSIRGMEG